MDTFFNFGDPHKDFKPVADEILEKYEVMRISITNNRIFYNNEFQIVDAAYGPSMVLDSLNMMMFAGKLNKHDKIIFLGSMGSLSSRINLDDFVVPTELHCAYYGNEGNVITPDERLLGRMRKFTVINRVYRKDYCHGSVMAVFDPTTDHKTYKNSLYGKEIEGIDCSESYIGLKFCQENGLSAIVLLYCSDSPTQHISDISQNEFDRRALEKDLELHKIAKGIFRTF